MIIPQPLQGLCRIASIYWPQPKLLSQLGYCVRIVILNASQFAAPSSRTRMFAVGIKTDRITFKYPPAQFMTYSCNQSVCSRCSSPSFYMLVCVYQVSSLKFKSSDLDDSDACVFSHMHFTFELLPRPNPYTEVLDETSQRTS